MRRLVLAGLIAIAAVLAVAPISEAGGRHGHHHGHRHGHFRHGGHARVFIGVGPSFYWGPRWHYYPAPYAVYAPPPVVVQESPPVYVQQQTPPPPPPVAAPEQQYWYYCESAKAYYPAVPSCPEAWVLVPPRP